MEEKQIFRKKSLEKVRSPEELNSYIRGVSPGVWIVLCAVIVLLAGAFVFCAFNRFESETVPVCAVIKNGRVTVYMDENDRTSVRSGMKLRIGDFETGLPAFEGETVKLHEQTDYLIMEVIGAEEKEYAYAIRFDEELLNGINGVFEAGIVTGTVSPLSLLFN